MKLKCPNCGKTIEGENLVSFLNKDCPYCNLLVLSSADYNELIDAEVYGHRERIEEDEDDASLEEVEAKRESTSGESTNSSSSNEEPSDTFFVDEDELKDLEDLLGDDNFVDSLPVG